MNERSIPYYRPAIEPDEINAVVDSMRNGWLTTGPKVKEFESAFSSACGVKHAVAVNSCTAALHLGLIALGVGPGDEVVMPSLTFVAGAQCVLHLGATPVFADVEKQTLCLTLETVKSVLTTKTKAIIPMQYGGAPVDIDPIVNYARSNGIRVLEDAAHAVGALDSNGRWAGSVSDAAAYSFYATKNITSAEGGMFVTNDDRAAELVRVLSLHGMDRDAWKRYMLGSKYSYDVLVPGYKYNMPDMAAAMGVVQLRKLGALQGMRDQIARSYFDALRGENGVAPVAAWPTPPQKHSWCVFAILVEPEEIGVSRDAVIAYLSERGVGTSMHFIPTHRLTAFRERPHAQLPITEWAAERLISLPLYPGMSTEDVAYVVEALKWAIKRGRSQALSS